MTHLELVLENVFLAGQLAVETEELLLLLAQGLIYVLATTQNANRVSPTLMSTLLFLCGFNAMLRTEEG